MSYEQTAFCGAVGRGEEIFWVNPAKKPYEAVKASLPFSHAQIEDAASRLSRFAPFLQIKFPETVPTNGLIESPLREIAQMRAWLHKPCPEQMKGRLLLKMDSHLAAAGSVKARGGIYEILHHAETLALEHGMLKDGDSYARFADPDFRDFFGKFSLHVGSTGNLGLSVGVIGAAFGFKTCVHMSADAKQWKKDLLRSRGVEVREYASDYSAAVAAGQNLAQADPTAYFVDDEQSGDLFLGYAVAVGDCKSSWMQWELSWMMRTRWWCIYPAASAARRAESATGSRKFTATTQSAATSSPRRRPACCWDLARGRWRIFRARTWA